MCSTKIAISSLFCLQIFFLSCGFSAPRATVENLPIGKQRAVAQATGTPILVDSFDQLALASPHSVAVGQGMPLVALAWDHFIAKGPYKMADASDFVFPDEAWRSARSTDLKNFIQQPFGGNLESGLAVVVIDASRNDSERFGVVIFKEPVDAHKNEEVQPFWLYRNRDLSKTQLSGDSEGLTLTSYREDGSYSFCHIKWNRRFNQYKCLDLSGKEL